MISVFSLCLSSPFWTVKMLRYLFNFNIFSGSEFNLVGTLGGSKGRQFSVLFLTIEEKTRIFTQTCRLWQNWFFYHVVNWKQILGTWNVHNFSTLLSYCQIVRRYKCTYIITWYCILLLLPGGYCFTYNIIIYQIHKI